MIFQLPLAFQLLFATNFFSANTPQGSSANLLFAGSGYISQGDLYRLGASSVHDRFVQAVVEKMKALMRVRDRYDRITVRSNEAPPRYGCWLSTSA